MTKLHPETLIKLSMLFSGIGLVLLLLAQLRQS